MKTWTPQPGQVLEMLPEPNNSYDKFATAAYVGDKIVGRVPKELSKLFHELLESLCATGTVISGEKIRSKKNKEK